MAAAVKALASKIKVPTLALHSTNTHRYYLDITRYISRLLRLAFFEISPFPSHSNLCQLRIANSAPQGHVWHHRRR